MSTVTNLWGTFEIDDNTGLPSLPEGYKWRFTRGIDSYDYIQMITNRPFFPKVIAWTTVKRSDFSPESLVYNACYVVLRRQEQLETDPASISPDAYFGTYPPDKLTRDHK